MSRNITRPRWVVCVLGLLLLGSLCARARAGVAIQFDFTYDQYGFFSDVQRRDLLDLGAAQVIRFIDRLEPIVPSGSDAWTYYVPRPDGPQYAMVGNDTIPADTIKVYVGAQSLSSSYLALTSGAGIFTISGTQAWKDTVHYRGQGGAAGDPAVDYSPFAASITYNSAKTWHFGQTTEGLGVDRTDFLTVTMHELFHVLGMGPAESWRDQIVGGRFTGARATAVGSSTNPELELDAGGGHWREGTVGLVGESPRTALLKPSIALGERRWPTGLDRAALLDTGWIEAAPGDTDLDRDIDGLDIQNILSANKFAAGPSNAAWAEGDFDGNQKVDGLDIQMILATNLFGAGPYAAAAPGMEGDRVADLVLDPTTGSLVLDADSLVLNGYVVRSTAGVFTGAPASNLGWFTEDGNGQISGNMGFQLSDRHVLGSVIGAEFLGAGVDWGEDLTFTYTLQGQAGTLVGTLIVVPEPGAVAVLLSGLLAMVLALAVGRLGRAG